MHSNWSHRDPRSKKDVKSQAIVLGLGSMFNHSSRGQNVGWYRDSRSQTVIYKALRDIQAGEELCISYGAHLWFDDIETSPDQVKSNNDIWDALGQIEWDMR